MDEREDRRYSELTEAMFTGEVPSWVPPEAQPGLQLASERKRTELAGLLAARLPRFSYYATAIYGLEFVHGVARCLLKLKGGANSLLDRTIDAAELWAAGQDPNLGLVALANFDQLLVQLTPYDGADRTQIGAHLGLTDDFSLKHFDYDILAFTQLLGRLEERHAPAEFVRRYRPIPQSQWVVAFRVGAQVRAVEWKPTEGIDHV